MDLISQPYLEPKALITVSSLVDSHNSFEMAYTFVEVACAIKLFGQHQGASSCGLMLPSCTGLSLGLFISNSRQKNTRRQMACGVGVLDLVGYRYGIFHPAFRGTTDSRLRATSLGHYGRLSHSQQFCRLRQCNNVITCHQHSFNNNQMPAHETLSSYICVHI